MCIGEKKIPWIFMCRDKLDVYLDLPIVQLAIIVLVLSDLWIVTALLLIALDVIHSPSLYANCSVLCHNVTSSCADSSAELAERALHICELFVLSLFAFEILLRMIAKRSKLCKDVFQVFDAIIVLVVFVSYVVLTVVSENDIVQYCIAYLIILRLWRIHRLYTGILETAKKLNEKIMISHRKSWKLCEEEKKACEEKVIIQAKEIAYLQSLLHRNSSNGGLKFRSITQPSPQQKPKDIPAYVANGSTNEEIVSINKVKEKFTPETKHRTIATTSAVAAKYVNQLQESENQHRASTNKIGTHNKAYDFSDIQRDVILDVDEKMVTYDLSAADCELTEEELMEIRRISCAIQPNVDDDENLPTTDL